MPRLLNRFARVDTVLVSAVADDATFTVAYPTGFAQADFLSGLEGASGHYMIVNDNDRYTVGASGFTVSFGASEITVTNTTGASMAAGSSVSFHFDVADGNDRVVIAFPIDLASITAADVVTGFQPGIDGVIESTWFVVDKAVTTAAKLATLNWEIGTTDLTGGTIALTSAAATPKGKVIAGSAITAANTITRASLISLEASSVTAFSEGTGTVYLAIRRTPSGTA